MTLPMPRNDTPLEPLPEWRQRIYRTIFESDTPHGKAFDLALAIVILLSVVIVAVESVSAVEAMLGFYLRILEWVLTLFFTVEYVLRLLSFRRPWKYALSFFGLVDLLSILPTYIAIFYTGAGSLLVIRTLRLVRMFRVLKLANFMIEAQTLINALKASRSKITVFVTVVMIMVVISGTLMYLIESQADSGFTSIPRAMYWAIVTMTTVGYGDIAPRTALGQFLAAMLMVSGYAIIAVPTGIVSAELVLAKPDTAVSTRHCPECATEGHDPAASYCYRCGADLDPSRVSQPPADPQA